MKKTFKMMAALSAILLLTAAMPGRKITVFMIGDSTMANKDTTGDKQERGWGMMLQPFFKEGVVVDNHAVNGRSSKSFIVEGRWQAVLDRMQPGDYVIIQFGHNDEKPKPDRHTDPGTTFDANLTRFVIEARAKGGIPILCNAVVRRNFYRQVNDTTDDESLRNTIYGDEVVNSDTLIDTHGAYLLSPRNVAARFDVPFIDANRITHDLEQGLGVEGSRKLHMWFKPGEHPSLPDGRKDNTHYNVRGGTIVAALLAEEIGKQVPALRKYINKAEIKKIKRELK